jgi:hypothetical protein
LVSTFSPRRHGAELLIAVDWCPNRDRLRS